MSNYQQIVHTPMLLTSIAPIDSYDHTGAGYPIEAVDGAGKISSLVYRRVSMVHGCKLKMVGSSIIDILGALRDRDEGTNLSGWRYEQCIWSSTLCEKKQPKGRLCADFQTVVNDLTVWSGAWNKRELEDWRQEIWLDAMNEHQTFFFFFTIINY